MLDINKGEETITADETEFENSSTESKDNETIDENKNSKRKSMTEIVNSVVKIRKTIKRMSRVLMKLSKGRI